jgi:hypothetical protein
MQPRLRGEFELESEHKAKWEYFRAVYELLSQSGAVSEALDGERILPEHQLPPEMRDSCPEWTSSQRLVRSGQAYGEADLMAFR